MSARRKRKTPARGWPVAAAGVFLAVFCFWYAMFKLVEAMDAREGTMLLATGYCNCGECCGWTRGEDGVAVYSYGEMKGRPKEIGRTSGGTIAKHGTIAADPAVFPHGTVIRVPGYGEGVVEDVGGAIKGNHIDLWFPSHGAAKRWGARRVKCIVHEPMPNAAKAR